ncbi:LysR family transcriptional regulator [Methylophilus sp. 5]|uniref:LysR family transcriptional regulator n=1 Tax=Methylophilus sp. 5 TaxID=1112274 RepID=UPI0004B50228|nr:LysR family transcriptional regulator [Methylophilus sp. 5]
MRVFASVAEEGGFAAASRKLDLSPAAVTRAIVALEEQLGARLLQRTTRHVRFTDAGRQYYDNVRAILVSIAEANDAVAEVNATPRGTLSITAPVMFGRMFVMPCIIDYMQRYPQVNMVAHLVDRVTNLVDEGMDVAIRIGHLPDSGLRAIKVGQVRRVLCASPAYLEKFGAPQSPANLTQHSIISSSAVSPHIEWRFQSNHEPLLLKVNPRLTVTSNDAALAAAIGGLGIARLLSYQVSGEVKSGALRLVLEDYEEAPWPVHIVHREDKLGSSKVRSFIDEMVEHLRGHPTLML